MTAINNFAHAVVTFLTFVSKWILASMDWAESSLRSSMHAGGVGVDLQTVLILFVICMFLWGALRLFKGRLRTSVALFLFLFLAHTLERLGHGPLMS
jgi:hypothetical protein